MSNLKGKVSLLLALVMMMMTVLPIVTVNAAEDVGTRRMMTATASYKGSTLADGTTLTVEKTETNRTISVKISDIKATSSNAASNPNLSKLVIYYSWDGNGLNTAASGKDNATITIPSFNAGTNHVLQIEGVINDNDGGYVGQSSVVTLYFKVPADKAATTVTTVLKNGSATVSSKVTVPTGTKLDLSASTNNGTGVINVAYVWDDGEAKEISGNKTTITVPATFEPGTTHTLKVSAEAADGTIAPVATYTITIPKAEEPVTPVTPNVDDELIVEPWMKENKDLDGLAVSLRNDSDENEKSNKNIYALNEKVTYYVDYKNGSDKTKKDVKLVLELPLDVTVVDACGGKVNGKTITWELGELEAEDAGTKTVVVKYTSLGKASVKSKIVYPVADIYEGKKVVDSSSVINLIFKDEDTEIVSDEHYPYMHGDAEADTFRPDDGITRAEGALVLTRIFGMNTSGVAITNVYPDLNETYEEAQKAIVAATKAGLINGYTDGTYRPNEKMTRAEFMKIIAANIELMADEDDIRGLEVKGTDELIKIYKNPTKSYVVNNTTVDQHWASPYVTLLARLNMTDLTEKNKDLRLDEEITRAEVAQLVNFYLFRAPAEVTSKTKSGFSDVNSKHKLFADIIEATRAAHTYTLTVEGTEVAVED